MSACLNETTGKTQQCRIFAICNNRRSRKRFRWWQQKWWSLCQHLPGHTWWYRLSECHFNLCTDAYASVLLSPLDHFAKNQRLEIFTQISSFGAMCTFCIQNQNAVLQPKVADSETPDRKANQVSRPLLCDASYLRSTSLGESSNWRECCTVSVTKLRI